MVKRFFGILFATIFILSLSLTLHADVVGGNDFFYENGDKTEIIGEEYLGKSFIINSPLGYVIPKEEPGSKKGIRSDRGYRSGWGYNDIEEPEYNVFVFKNGEIIRIEAVYLHNGEYWGVMSPSHIYQPPGWVLMDDLLMRYGLEDFETENKDRIYAYTGNFNALSFKKLVLWQWPGSDREKVIIEDENLLTYIKFEIAYKDSEGREWGKTTLRWGWICLSDPENNTEIPNFNPALNPVKWSHDGNRDWTKEVTVWPPAEPSFFQANPFETTIFVIILSIIFATGAAIGLICRIKHKKGKEEQQTNTSGTQ